VSFAKLAHQYRALLARPVDPGIWTDTAGTLRERAERDMFGEKVPPSSCIGTIRARDESDGTDYECGDAAVMPPLLSSGRGHAVLDYQATLPASGLTQFPAVADAGAGNGGDSERLVLFGKKPVRAQIVDAGGLAVDARGHGPCVLESPYWSAVLPAGWKWQETEFGMRLWR